jgi:cysteine desulfurase/selenocysteine lyase
MMIIPHKLITLPDENEHGRFEAGTGNIADAVGLGAAIDSVTQIGMDFAKSGFALSILMFVT